MSLITGYIKRKVIAYHYGNFLSDCNKLKSEGYYLVDAKKKIQWPFFWINKYTAKFRKDFAYDSEVEDSLTYLPNEI